MHVESLEALGLSGLSSALGAQGVELAVDGVIVAAGLLALRAHRRQRHHAAALGVSTPLAFILIGLVTIAVFHAIHGVAAFTAMTAGRPEATGDLAGAVQDDWSRLSMLAAFVLIGVGIDRLIRRVLPAARGWFERLELTRAQLAHEVEIRREAERRLRASNANLERQIDDRTTDLARSNRQLEQEIEQQRRLTREVEDRVGFEVLIGRVSAKLVYGGRSWGKAELVEVLREVGEFAGFDRAVLVELDASRTRLHSTVEWRRDGVPEEAPLLEQASRQQLARCIDLLRHGRLLHFEDLAYLAEDLDLDAACLATLGIAAAAGVPLMVGGELLGCLVVTRSQRADAWADETGRRLKVVADLLAAAIHRSRVEADLARQVENYGAIFNSANEAIIVHDADTGRILDVNRKMCEMWGYPRSRIMQMGIPDLSVSDPDYRPADALEKMRAAADDNPQLLEWRARAADGREFWVEVSLRAAEVGGDRVILAMGRDISERKEAERQQRKLEQQLVQSQRIEALGKLAGGVAHDFNNILTVIIGNANLASHVLRDAPDADPVVAGCLEEIEFSSERAGALTQQLLAFGRRQILNPDVVDLHEALADMEGMLRRLIAEDVKLELNIDPRTPRVLADASQIEQVVLNLVVNARDAMPLGGSVTIETFGRRTTQGDVELGWESSEDVAVLAVRDTGCGIEPDCLDHIFEPFFTTKPVGQGTGLGLSTVHGVVKQLGGSIQVTSEIDKGTSFEVTLKACATEVETPSVAEPTKARSAAGRALLVCEDDEKVRTLTCNVLRNGGYVVHSASAGAEALRLARTIDGPIDALITDVIMPGMNGRRLAELIRSGRPDMPVLFLSGYPADVLAPYGVMPESVELLEKPFRSQDLLERVADLLTA